MNDSLNARFKIECQTNMQDYENKTLEQETNANRMYVKEKETRIMLEIKITSNESKLDA